MPTKKINPKYRAAYKVVLREAVNDESFRDGLLGGDKKAAEQVMINHLGIDAALSKEIADSIYKNNSNFRKLQPDAKSLIKMMSYVFGNLPAPGPAKMKLLSLSTPGDIFDDIEDWENCW